MEEKEEITMARAKVQKRRVQSNGKHKSRLSLVWEKVQDIVTARPL